MKLEEYNSLEEKAPFFNNGGVPIDVNIEKIFTNIEEFLKKGDTFFFRGCSEAKYKLYNSAQRIYIGQELHKQVASDRISEHYTNFISNLIESCKQWNKGVVKNLLVSSGIDENNSLAYLSYMQHFGVPTPFLDYTFNPYVALYFATESSAYVASDNEIDNYFSFYYTYSKATAFKGFKYVFDKNLEKENISYESIAWNEMSILLPDSELYKIMNSVNIINQQGLFLYNNHPWYPLERTYKDYITEVKEKMGPEKFDLLLIHDTISGCYNIHKSLIPAIKKRLNELGINHSYIYPDSINFKNSVTNEGILKSLTLEK